MKAKVLLIMFALCAICWGCRSETNTTVPDHLIGVWKTSAPQYANRSLELSQDFITFGTGEFSANVTSIVNIEHVSEGGQTLYTIWYRNAEGEKDRFAFYYHPATATITAKNRKQVRWTLDRS